MELNENADIDTSQVEDRRGSGGGGGGLGGLPIGGGGLVGIIITIIVAVVGGYFGINQIGGGGDESADNTNLSQACAQDNATKKLECRNVLYINSIQAYWTKATPQYFNKPYQPAKTVIFSQRVNTACGAADSGVGPFYCPGDNKVYIDLAFYDVLSQKFGVPGEFAQPYVLAHEYGHHIQDITGTEAKMREAQQGASETTKNQLSVKLELQADCYAGSWAKNATGTDDGSGQKIFTSITADDIQQGLDTAAKIGDDTLQQR
ncbi:MAG TPA: neutral zinc metallopeptidase, partial [Actinoplanes sp.]|nr:neutral zinc metallopeptidase [Actinoplanes sp.]